MPAQSTSGPFLCIATIFGSKPKAGNTGMAIPICPELLHATVSCSSAAGSLASQRRYIHNTDFRNVNGYLRMTYDSPKAGFFDFQTGGQGRRFGSNGFYAAYNPDQFEQTATALGSLRWIKEWGLFRICADASYRKNFDRYEWTRGTPTNYHNTDNVGAELWGDLQWRGGSTSLGGDYIYHHIFSSNLGEPMAAPRRPLQVRSRTPRGQSVGCAIP